MPRLGRTALATGCCCLLLAFCAYGADRHRLEEIADNLAAFEGQTLIASFRLDSVDDRISERALEYLRRKLDDAIVFAPVRHAFIAVRKGTLEKTFGSVKPNQRIWGAGRVEKEHLRGRPLYVLVVKEVRPYYDLDAAKQPVGQDAYAETPARDIPLLFDKLLGKPIHTTVELDGLQPVEGERFTPMALDPAAWTFGRVQGSDGGLFIPADNAAVLATLKGLPAGSPVEIWGVVVRASDYARGGRRMGNYVQGRDRDVPGIVVHRAARAEAPAPEATEPSAPEQREAKRISPRAYGKNPVAYDGQRIRVLHIFRGSELLRNPPAVLGGAQHLQLKSEATDLADIRIVYPAESEAFGHRLRALEMGDRMELTGAARTIDGTHWLILDDIAVPE